MAINYELDKRGITTPRAFGAALGMPKTEVVNLLTRHWWHEDDVAWLKAVAARLGVQPPGL